jgi:hypothetical protein
MSPEQVLESYVRQCHAGAVYHFQTIDGLLKDPLMNHTSDSVSIDEDTRRRVIGCWQEVHWHTRAFFWELIAMFDTSLRWANTRYQLGTDYFRWRDDRHRKGLYYIEKGAAWTLKKEIINRMWQSEWFQEIRKFRNHSHEGFFSYLAEYQCVPEHGQFKPVKFSRTTLLPVKGTSQLEKLDLIGRLDDYLTKIEAEANRIFDVDITASQITYHARRAKR